MEQKKSINIIKKRMVLPKWVLFYFLALSFFVGNNVSAENEISVLTKIDREKITIGDQVKYTVTLEFSPEIKIPALRANLHLEAFELVKPLWGSEEKTQKGQLQIIDEYTISTFTTGDYVVPPYQVDYILPDGSNASIISASHLIVVESVNPNIAAIEDIAPIKTPVDIPLDQKKLILIVILSFIAVCLVVLLIIKFLRKSDLEEEIPILPPYETACIALKKIKNEKTIEKHIPKVFALEISSILKNYILGLYGFDAPDLTTDEIRENLPDKISLEVQQKIISVLDNSDLIKFAKAQPEKIELYEDFNLTQDIVETLKPSPENETVFSDSDISPEKEEVQSQ